MRFSSRLHWDLRPNRLSALLDERRRAGARVLDLTESNPTRAALPYPAREILEPLARPPALVYDPTPAGLPAAREAVCAYYAGHGQAVTPDRVLLTASTSEAYAYLFKLLADPGDEVLVPRPSYPLFEFLATLESVRVASYPLVYHGGWTIDLDALERAITERTRAIVLVNPNNPTGSFVKRDELDALVRLARDRECALISDEVFADYAFAPDPRRVATLAGVRDAPAFSMSGLSKVAGLPQMKLGWIVASGPEAPRREAMARLELIADTYLSVATPVQWAAPALLEAGAAVRGAIAQRTRDNLDYFRAAVAREPSFRVLAVEGGWYAILQVPRTRTEEEWVLELLADRDVLVQPGFFYDFESEAFLVVSLLAPPEVFREGVNRIVAPSYNMRST